MSLEKLPRSVLVWITGIALTIGGFITTRAVAEGDRTKAVAYQARNTADNAFELANDLKVQVADVRGAQEVFRREYREDRNKDAELLRSMEERIIRAVKS